MNLSSVRDLPAAAAPHVRKEDKNVVEDLQMHEHPDRWGGDAGDSEPVRSLRTLDDDGEETELAAHENSAAGASSIRGGGLWNGAALVPNKRLSA